MENLEEKIEALDEVIENLIPKVQALEKTVAEQPKIEIPDFGKDFDRLIGVLDVGHQMVQENLKALKKSTELLNIKIEAIPKPTDIKNYHHFDIKSKVFITSFVIAFLTVAVSVGLAVSFGIKSIERYHSATSYNIVRAFYPEVAKSVDDAYSANAEELIREAEIRNEEQKTLSATAYGAVIAEREKKKAKEELKNNPKPKKKGKKRK